METVADLLEDVHGREGAAVAGPDGAPLTADEAASSAWQMGNLYRHYGVRPGERVAVVPGPPRPSPADDPGDLEPSPVAILAVLGALRAGGLVDLDPPGAVDATVHVVPGAWLDRYRTGPRTTAVAYGADPGEPGVAHLEREAWSENPTAPPVSLDPTTPALAADRTYLQGDLLATALCVADRHELAAADGVALRAPLTGPGTLIGGVLAPLVAGATVVLGGDAPVVVAPDSRAGSRRIDPATVTGAGP